MSSQKIVFLDVDGVINNEESCRKAIGKRFDKKAIYEFGLKKNAFEFRNMIYRIDADALKRVIALCNKTNAKIVVVSNWRKFGNKDIFNAIIELVAQCSESLVIDCTPMLFNNWEYEGQVNQERGIEIQHWIECNKFKGKYIIIDDMSPKAFLAKHHPHLVNTNPKLGFTEADMNHALQLLDTSDRAEVTVVQETITPEDLKFNDTDNGIDRAGKYYDLISKHSALKDFPRIDEIKEFDEGTLFQLEEVIWDLRRWAYYTKNIVVA